MTSINNHNCKFVSHGKKSSHVYLPEKDKIHIVIKSLKYTAKNIFLQHYFKTFT